MIAANQIPNILTMVRIFLILPFAICVYGQQYFEALIIFFVAGLSDGVDGFLARQFNWKSRFGAIADPLADKLLLMTAYIMLALMMRIPVWLVVLILARDFVIVVGALLYHFFVSHYEIQPSLLGKACTLTQIVYVLLVIIYLAELPMPYWAVTNGIWLVAGITSLSGIHYLIAWGLKAYRLKSGEVDKLSFNKKAPDKEVKENK